MSLIILGCGSSGGVPLIGCKCEICLSEDPKNKRQRSSILYQGKNGNILIDTSTDLRNQALKNNITKVDAVIYTHEHADHILGIDDLRSFNYLANKPLDIYATKHVIKELEERFPYAFTSNEPNKGWYKPWLIPHQCDFFQIYQIAEKEVQTFKQIHGKILSMGIRIDNFAYSTDLDILPEESLSSLMNLDLWVLDCLSMKPSFGHAYLDLALSWIEIVKPKRTILTHMGHEIDYATLKSKLPANVVPAYDGMQIEL